MEHAPIRPAPQAAAHPLARTSGARAAAGNEAAGRQEQDGFSLLLAGMAEPALGAGAALLEEGVQPMLEPAQPSWAEAGIFSLASLVGQTARMDGAADAALRDGRTLVDEDSTRALGALPMGAGRSGAGAQAPAQARMADSAGGGAAASSKDVTDAMDIAPVGDAPEFAAASSTLSLASPGGGTERGAPPPGLAALLARMDAEPAPAAPALAALSGAASAAGASGTAGAAGAAPAPGMGQAVADTAALASAEAAPALAEGMAEDGGLWAPPDEALTDALTQQVAFWVQQKTQRAEMTLDRQGQPLQVQVSVTGNEAHVTFRSNEQQTRDMLDASTAQLRELLAQQGLNLAGVTVQADAGRQPPGGAFASEERQERGRPPARAGGDDGRHSGVVSVDAGAGRARAGAARAVDLFV